MKKVQFRACVVALALAISLSATAPAFARNHEPRDVRERVLRLIKKIQTIVGVGTNNDGLTPPKP